METAYLKKRRNFDCFFKLLEKQRANSRNTPKDYNSEKVPRVHFKIKSNKTHVAQTKRKASNVELILFLFKREKKQDRGFSACRNCRRRVRTTSCKSVLSQALPPQGMFLLKDFESAVVILHSKPCWPCGQGVLLERNRPWFGSLSWL